MDALAAEDLTAEFGPEDGTGGQGAAKIMRFAFPEFEDRVNGEWMRLFYCVFF